MSGTGEAPRPDAIDVYWAGGFNHVEGWVQAGVLPYLKHIDLLQRTLGISGHVAEIGCFHGKFLIALAALLEAGGKATAIDVFEDQNKNIDGSGVGSRESIMRNVATYGRADVDYGYVTADSIAINLLAKVELTRDRGPFRLFSVDGCHTAEHTLADLHTAQDCLAPGGVIILDDFMQPHWPGVTQALGSFCGGSARVAPFLYAHHKLFLVGLGWRKHFFDAFMPTLGASESAKVTTMYGGSVLSIYP